MWNCVFGILFAVLVSWSSVELHELPSYLKPCSRLEPSFLKCIEENVDVLRPMLKDGLPDLFIPSVDPLVVPPITVNEADKVQITFKDIKIFHVEKFRVDQFDIDFKKHTVDLTVTFPELRIKSTFEVNGRFLIISFGKNGPADGNYTNVQVHLGLKGTPYIQNESEYLKWEKETISIYVEKSHIILDNIFGNYTDIKEKTNNAINENIHAIVDDLQPVLQKVISDLVFSVVDKLFSNYSVDELFVH